MTEPTTSAEHLENLFREGKISQSDYEMLRQTLETKAREEAAARQETAAREAAAPHDVAAPAPRRLCKSWTNRQVGGVCGGIADYFGLDALLIRAAALLLVLLSCSSVMLVYLVMYFALPWDPSYAEHKIQVSERRHGWLPFASTLCALWILDLAILTFGVPYLADIYAQVGAELPAACRIVLSLSSLACQYGILTLPIQMLFLAGLVCIYAIMPNGALRRGYAWLVCALFLLPAIVVALTAPLALYDLPEYIR